MSDTTVVDTAATPSVASTPAAPPQASDPQVSAPASADTAATGQDEPKRPSRSESRAFATMRRENRELHRQLGRMEAMYESLQGSRQTDPPADGQPPRQERSPAQVAATQDAIEHARNVRERIEDAGDEIEGFEKVMDTITADSFPINRVMLDFLGETDKPAQMAQWLADNPSEARRISRLSDAVAVRALERAEAKLGTKPAARTTNTPPPPPTVNGRSTPSFDPEKASMDDYAAHWRERRTKAGIR